MPLLLKMLNPIEAGLPTRPRRVLVVEDDPVSRTFLRLTLQKRGYHVIPVETVAAAQRQFNDEELDRFDCVISDYWMPDHTGLDLLRWLKTKDPCLATIILTGEGEKNLVTESLRLGAADFLEKPVNVQKLLAALDKATGQTAHQRRMARSDSAVKTLGRTQRWMMQSDRNTGGNFFSEVCFYPHAEAGGDFLGHFPVTPEVHCCLLTDVSGHDLQAAYISAYFHGIFHGMLLRAAPLPEIFGHFNEFLVRDWNQTEQLQVQNAIGTSLAAAALLLDSRQQLASVILCGAPVPIYVSPDGRAQALGESGGPPLGWFPDLEIRTTVHSIGGGGTIYWWTDGLADLAEAQGVHPLCLAFALQQAKERALKLPLLDEAKDDILFAAIFLPAADVEVGLLQPLLVENYRGDQDYEVDEFAAAWRRNLKLALPELSEMVEHDILLAMREALLNAMKHGCARQAEKTVRVQASYHRLQRLLRVWVEDPGSGHQFDFAAHVDHTAQALIDEHRGLMFIMNLAHAVKFERNGATVIMEFQL